ncbi:phosphatase PAP2 family protein [Vibrio navarrensis]|uniref:phosphatase PAP2 family protein n=1 Tax=Vibrio navarrensis TaxID=29495 RepID=UPI001DE4A970|nr:hypothetical protein [Vibrio navarrensis]MBE3670305.1 hypothetical protein [Vibrio navarrensis]
MDRALNFKLAGLIALFCYALCLGVITWLYYPASLFSPVASFEGRLLTLLTYSAGSQGFFITLIILCIWALSIRTFRRGVLQKFLQLGLLLIIGFASKSGLKLATESPRPYSELLAAEQIIDSPADFYRLDEAGKVQAISAVSQNVSPWRSQHWQGEKDYSFPSGHTLFAAICVAFFGAAFLSAKRYGALILLLVWASSVAYSRLWLGMHSPLDLFGSWAFVAIVFTLLPNHLPIVSQWKRG